MITFRAIPGGEMPDGWYIECSPPGLQPFVWASYGTRAPADAAVAKLMNAGLGEQVRDA